MDILFTILTGFLLVQSLTALLAVVRWSRYARQGKEEVYDDNPDVVVIIPCKGIDPRFEDNIIGYLAQAYKRYQIIFVTEAISDPAHAALKRILNESSREAWLITAGEAEGKGQKVHNLCAALDLLDETDRHTDVLVFADADALPSPTWLSDLVGPLRDPRIGATTGFRWYLAGGHSLASRLLSVWNSSALSLLGERSIFAWGGATGIRRSLFEDLKIRELWEQGAVSDDYVLSRAIHAAGMRIKFVPQCLAASESHGGWRELFEFTTRQITITKVYAPRVWALTLATNLYYSLTFFGGIAAWLAGWIHSLSIPAMLVAGYLCGSVTGWLRSTVASELLAEEARGSVRRNRWAFLFFHPVVNLLYLWNLLVSALTSRIVWRGIGYELRSPSETVIWNRPVAAATEEKAGEGRTEIARTGVGE